MLQCGARRSSLLAVAPAVVLLLLLQGSAPASAQRHRRQQKQRQQRQQLPGRTSTPCVVCLLSARPSATPAQPYAGFNASLSGAPQPLGFAINATAVAAATAATLASASSTGGWGPGARAGGPRGHGFVYVPRSYDPRRPSPLAVMLHGAGGRADPLSGNWSFGGAREVEDSRLIIVVPESAGRTWDAVRGGSFGPDVVALDGALSAVFAAFAVDASRVALAGHSDGASYALSLGLANPQLFTHLLAFSPGFMRPQPAAEAAMQRAGSSTHSGSGSSMHSGSGSGSSSVWPRVFVSHGTGDRVLPVGCSRGIVTRLRAARIDVSYHEFEGGHVIPGHVAAEGLSFFLSGAGSTGGGGGARE
ncbi:hypothetical protein HYH02_011653 [Chlamydomonas schloesseri]|uniref:Phospholipase/carboxylesterase/thioesterase domain-containing protein n=1 Tax=Chlamydomonas schloesseri TaxID=2026947 RepID=A0A835SZN3_9CHLO|nr:hypothetical protein HYH02_011653 [Chlamydomonas schloesseri]|eukprot:KAG2436149.1 hypothetical protein HYH02_011653 [Chlamydomonas schloesseri]